MFARIVPDQSDPFTLTTSQGRAELGGSVSAKFLSKASTNHVHISWRNRSAEVDTLSFDRMGLDPELTHDISAYGLDIPTYLQQRRHVIAQGSSGLGEVAAVAIASLQLVEPARRATQVLILTPSRHLACARRSVLRQLSETRRVSCHVCINSATFQDDVAALQAGAQIVLGTPGRLLGMLASQSLQTDGIRLLVLDEADEMLARGFEQHIFDVVQLLPHDVQLALVSHNNSAETTKIGQRLMRDPLRIPLCLEQRAHLSLNGVKQFYLDFDHEEWRLETMFDLLELLSVPKIAVFCNSVDRANALANKLRKRKHDILELTTGLEWQQRADDLSDFRSGQSTRIIISTQTFGVQVNDLGASVTINYDCPINSDEYLRGIGRGDCHGRRYICITFASSSELRTLREVQQRLGTDIEALPLNIALVLQSG
ncbi:P-loop containing nucleoside triphosphate hydrolase protein [Auriculariales sp. MPI-PUGE-AT-0066]|nr:P-loop containing nucleoside triphosphate hydrolase protein [Auriculariales sp. MPI-PUGE-AT-0066]